MGVFDKKLLGKMSYWIVERDGIRQRKDAGKPKPWTEDALLRDHRWCNVRRMDDRVSKWLLEHWYTALKNKRPATRDTLAAAALARLLNWPDSLATLGNVRTLFTNYPPALMADTLKAYKAKGNKVFTGAYIVNGVGFKDKIDMVVHQVCEVHAKCGKTFPTQYMRETWQWLQQIRGIGSFMAGQIVADLRWVVEGSWDDRFTWAPVGPGSARGMRRLLSLPHVGPLKQSQFDDLLPALWDELMGNQQVSDVFDDRCCEAMDLQNCLCEFDKYMRLTLNEGSVRSGYNGKADAGQGQLV